jgi:hypothetical protein
MGFNYFGQCGFPPSSGEIFDYYKPVEIPLDEGESILKIGAGKAHNVVLTSLNRLFLFGSVRNNQIPGVSSTYGLECSGPWELNLDSVLKQNEKVISFKIGFNRTALFTNESRVLVFGERDTRKECRFSIPWTLIFSRRILSRWNRDPERPL